MRRLIATFLVLSALLIAGCGGGGDSGSPLDTALSYLPKDAPFAVAIDTDVEGEQYRALQALLKKFPFGEQLQQSLRQQLEQSSNGVNFNDDVKPVLGNPFVVGATDAKSFTGDSGNTAFVAAIRAKDKDALGKLVDKTKPKKTGEQSGATLYEDNGTVFAVKDDVAVFAATQQQLKQALERADGDNHLDEDAFNKGLDGLPESALARVYTNLEALLGSDPGTADARKIKWVDALRTLGLTVAVKKDALEVDFVARTEGDLSDDDLPIAPGDDAPDVIKREGEIGLGIRDLAHIVKFAENAGQAIDPGGFGDYTQAKKTIDKQLGISLDDDLIGQLTGDMSASVSIDGKFGVRAQLKDPQAFERTLAKVSDVLPSFAEGAGFGTVGLSKPTAGEDFYALAQPDGDAVVFGVIEDVLVVANDPARAGELAGAEPTAVPGAKGSVVTSADAEQLVNALLAQLGPALGLGDLGGLGGALFTRPLGDLSGFMSASGDGLRGKLSLAIE
ncbi:MAG TPA: DUF3352 domain-containing protein [Thermoleophilaceae bacterium]|nr:DUF3352 domain-containing protein [Thermoleophilaceae bacterium]